MTSPDRQDAVAAAKGLAGSVDNLGDDVRGLAAAVRRSRLLIRLLAAGGAVLTAVVVVAVIALVQSRHASTQAATANAKAAAIHASNLASCQAGNGTRSKEVQLWDKLYAASTKTPETAKQRRANADLIAYIRKTFAPRNCTALYRAP